MDEAGVEREPRPSNGELERDGRCCTPLVGTPAISLAVDLGLLLREEGVRAVKQRGLIVGNKFRIESVGDDMTITSMERDQDFREP